MATKKKNNTYDGSNINVYEGTAAIRKRPTMYGGSLQGMALHLVKEIVDNSVDEFLNNHGDMVEITYDQKINMITVRDNGRGMPIDIHPVQKIPTIELLVTKIHAGGKFDKESFKVSSGLNGVGATLVNAVSKYFSVMSIRDGYQYSMAFEKGVKVSEFKKEKQTSNLDLEHGTIISFIPDEEILKEFVNIDLEELTENLKLRSYANAGLKITFTSGKITEVYHNPDGIKAYMRLLNPNPISQIYQYSATSDKGDQFEVVFAYSQNSNEVIKSFVNGISTSKGVHETGFKMGLTNAMTKFIRDSNLLPKKMLINEVSGDDIRSGLVCIINTRVVEALYSGQTKDELSNSDIQGFMTTLTNKSVTGYILENDKEFKLIANRIIQFAKGRISANNYKDKISKVDSGSLNLTMSNKFTDCNSNKIEERELLIVEGDSAATSVRGGRDPETQAMYSLRGKILNVYGKGNATIMANKEISELCNIIFGTNDMRNINYDKCNFGKIICLADADDDGAHINSLLGELFFEKFRPLIERGVIYVALPPKYRFSEGKDKFSYIQNDTEMVDFQYKKISKTVTITESKLKLKELIRIKDSFMTAFGSIRNAFSISKDLISIFFSQEEEFIEDDIERLDGLKVDENGYIKGLYDGYWHDVDMYMLIDRIEKELEPIYSVENGTVTFKVSGSDEEYTTHLIDFYDFLDSEFKFEFDYFKGLGESDASELKETTLDANNRTLIKLDIEDVENAKNVSRDFYGTSDKDRERRRSIMNEYFANKK